MTYCCGILVRDGLVMIADTRTNAGLDNVSTFRKLHVYSEPGERIMAIASSGNLSLSQSVRSILTEGVQNPETGEIETLMNSPTMFQAAQRIGRTIRNIQSAEGQALEAAEVDHEVRRLIHQRTHRRPKRRHVIGFKAVRTHSKHQCSPTLHRFNGNCHPRFILSPASSG